MQTNPAVEQSKIIKWSESLWNQSGRKIKGLWRKGFAESKIQNERLNEWGKMQAVIVKMVKMMNCHAW